MARSSIGDMIRAGGQARADSYLRGAEIQGNLAQNLASIAGQTITGIAQARADDRAQAEQKRQASVSQQIREALKLTRDPETGKLDMNAAAREATTIDPVEGLKWWAMASEQEKGQLAADAKKAESIARSAMFLLSAPEPRRAQLYAEMRPAVAERLGVPLESLPEMYDEQFVRKTLYDTLPFTEAVEMMGQAAKDVAEGKFRVKVPGPNGEPIDKLVTAEDLEQGIQVWQEPKDPKKFPITVAGPGGRPIQKLVTEDELAQGIEVYREPKDTGSEPLMAVMGDDGQPVYLPRSQAIGRRPANNREQGRAVTSGDAGRIAEFDTSLDDVGVLRQTVLPTNPVTGEVTEFGTTGTAAKIGASLWNPITELTGIGEEAKSRQAVIDRVKQVIGKALEGGVLRKEDEAKYEKILPTIGDTAAVVKTKLEGLEKAIRLRRERQIDALEDAGYDVARFRARSGVNPLTGRQTVTAGDGPPTDGASSPREGDRMPIPGVQGAEAEYRGGKWIRVK